LTFPAQNHILTLRLILKVILGAIGNENEIDGGWLIYGIVDTGRLWR
jgi:hypothetical protein